MKRKLVAIFNILTCKNYLLVTYRNHDFLFDHTMHEKDAVKYSKNLIDHYESIEAGQEIVLLQAKDILGIYIVTKKQIKISDIWGMKEVEILKQITELEAENLFNHSDDIEQVLQSFDNETTNFLPFNLVVTLVNNGFLG